MNKIGCCETPRPYFRQGMTTMCANCGKEFEICPAPVALPEEKSSSSIGELPQIGPHESVSLTQLQRHSKAMLHLLYEQSHQIKDLQQTTKFLAEQVKTLVDALAEEQEDPDRPITSYMSGKPV